MLLRRLLPILASACLAALALPALAAAAEPYDPDASTENRGSDPPSPTVDPAISGLASPGGTLTGDRGTWPNGTQLSSRWLRCDVAASACVSTGDTDLSYTVTNDDVGSVIKLRVIAVKPGLLGLGGGTRVVDSAPTGTIEAAVAPGVLARPVNVQAPRIQGVAQVGTKLTALPGQWTGAQPLRFSYGWFSCTARRTACESRSTSKTYTPGTKDRGRRLVLSVLAFNTVGSASKTAESPLVAARPLARLGPFPKLLIDGRVAGRTTSITTFRFSRVPSGALVSISCRGGGCPYRSARMRARKASRLAVPRLQRPLRSGTVVVVTVRRGQTLGKYTRLRFRANRPPARIDRCVKPGSAKPVACP